MINDLLILRVLYYNNTNEVETLFIIRLGVSLQGTSFALNIAVFWSSFA
jgi:hypothetical protein